jgi:hypothetical protein
MTWHTLRVVRGEGARQRGWPGREPIRRAGCCQIGGAAAESVTAAAELALELRDETHTRGLVVADQMTVIPDELRSWPHRTLKTRTAIAHDDVVAVIRPSYDLLIQVRMPENGFVVVAEDPSDPLGGWAGFIGARNMVTGEVLTGDVDEAVQEALDELIDSGYKGWTDERSKVHARNAGETLRALGLSRTQILGYVLSRPMTRQYDRLTPFTARDLVRLRTLLP